jgi:hypothetical protein
MWLSGDIVTPINKIGPFIWVAGMVGALSGVLLKSGQISIAPAFRVFFCLSVVATVFLFWLSARLQRVGVSGKELVVSNYASVERIPFRDVESVDSVWWYRRRMVRIQLRCDSRFGHVVYYIPKWAAIRCLWVAPEKELRELMTPAGSELN